MITKNLILASSSIYRQELLSRLKIPFSVFKPHIDESIKPEETVSRYVHRLAHEKAKAAFMQNQKAICIGSDQVAAWNDELIGKPGNKANAIAQLTKLSGQKVNFYTGICVLGSDFEENRLVTCAVKFRKLTPSMIENYLLKDEPYQCAASFKSESLGCAIMENFKGDDPAALIGLPLIALCEMLEKAGVKVL